MRIENDVLIGKSKYLFLWEGRQKQFSYLLQKVVPDEASIRNFKQNIKTRQEFCQDKGIDYNHIVFPSKPLVKQEYLPENLAVKSVYNHYYAVEGVTYPLKALLKAEKEQSMYRVLDTHMTDYGSLAIVKHLFPKYYRRFLAMGSQFYERTLPLSGDLLKMVDGESKETYQEIKLEAKKFDGSSYAYSEHNNFKNIRSNGGGVSLMYSSESVTQKRLMIFGDSFMVAMLHLLRPLFREIVYIRSEYFKPELVHLYQPDHVITANAERYLQKVHGDTSALFAQFEDIERKFYSEERLDAQFIQTYKAFFSRTFDKRTHKKHINTLGLEIQNASITQAMKQKHFAKAKHHIDQYVKMKPSKEMMAKRENPKYCTEVKKLPLPNLESIQKYANHVFISDFRWNDVWLDTYFQTHADADIILLFQSALETLSTLDLVNVQESTIAFNNVMILAYIIENYHDQYDLFASWDQKTLILIYRLLLASYFFKAAHQVNNLIVESLLTRDGDLAASHLLTTFYHQNRAATEGMMETINGSKDEALSLMAHEMSRIFFKQGGDLPPLDDNKNQDFYQYIRGKSVALIGPTEAEEAYGSEIDDFDIVVRLSYLGDEKSISDTTLYGSKTSVSYFSAHLRFYVEEISQLSRHIDFICVTLPKFGPEVLAYPNIRETLKFEFCYLGKPNLIQAALMEMLYFQPSRVKVFCSNLFLTTKPYNSAYPSTEMLNTVAKGKEHRGMNGITFTNHDPINNFLIMKRLYDNGVIEADAELTRVLELSAEDYMKNLQMIYA